jgi:PTS system nitrogen regulatory IIA component
MNQHDGGLVMSTLTNLLSSEDICLDMDVSNKLELFDLIGRHMERLYALPQEWVARSLVRREQAGSTGLGEGFAIPHARVKELDRMRIAYLRLRKPISYGSADDKPVSDILVLLAPSQAHEEHLKILADATRLFSSRRFRARLDKCVNPTEVKHLLEGYN